MKQPHIIWIHNSNHYDLRMKRKRRESYRAPGLCVGLSSNQICIIPLIRSNLKACLLLFQFNLHNFYLPLPTSQLNQLPEPTPNPTTIEGRASSNGVVFENHSLSTSSYFFVYIKIDNNDNILFTKILSHIL